MKVQMASQATTPELAGSSMMVESVVRHIDKMIGEGTLNPGDPISEPVLIATLGIGRVPVREAIRILAGEGLLELFPNRSARVRTVNATEILEMLDVFTGFSVIAMNLVGANPLPPSLEEALIRSAEKISQRAKEGATGNEIMQEITRYHTLVIKASNNHYILKLLRKTRIHYYSKFLVALLGRQAFIEAASHYGKITSALLRRDTFAAIRILLRSVDRSKSYAKAD